MRSGIALIALLLVCGMAAGEERALPPLRPLRTVPLPGVEGRFDHFAADVKGGRLFLAALGNDTLEVLDVRAGKRLRSVRGLREPQGVAFAPELGHLFVGNGEGGTCDTLDAASFARAGPVTGLEDADNVRYDAAAKQVWVGYGRGGLCALDAATGRRVGAVPLAAHPESFQLETSGPRIWVNVPGAEQVAVVDRARRKLLATWRLRGAGANFPMALDEAHHRLLVGCRRPARLLVLDTETGRQVASAEIAGDTDDLFYDAARKRVYIAGGEGFITVLEQRDPDHYALLARILTAPGARTAYWVPAWNQLFVAVPHRGSQPAEVRVFTAPP
ncbi:MAG TPA: YncE family protein [Armatimonadota bacterium]|nr:YncE family protein [Armatimonadota bacterium]